MPIWKYVPTTIGVLDRKTGRFYADAPVTGVTLHPPVASSTHPGTAIKGSTHLAEINTPYGQRTYGFAGGCIDSRLKMAVKLLDGQERDEVVMKWKKAPSNACGRAKAKVLGRTKRR